MAYDPKLDPNNSEYDAKLDPNAEEYDEKKANKYRDKHPESYEDEGQEQQADAPHLPGSTPKSSDTLRKAEKGEGSGGKSPLIFDPNAPAVDSVARQKNMLVEGAVDEDKTPQMQLMTAIGGGGQGVWQEYAHGAIRALYPQLRDGVDFVWGRKDEDSPPEMIYWNDKLFPAPDMGEIERISTQLLESDPYRPGGYTPRPPLHAGSTLGPGEVPKGERAQDQPEARRVPPPMDTGQPYNPPPIR